MDPLQRAASDAAAGRWPAVEALLVAAWRRAPSARIARTLAAIEPRLPLPAPIQGKTFNDRENRWHELAETADDAVLRTLLTAPWPTFPRDAGARVAVLGGWPRTPHISNALLALHARKQYPSNAGRRLSRQIFRVLLAQRDPAVGVYLAKLAEATDAVSLREQDDLASMLRRRLPVEPALDAAAEAALGRIDALAAPPDTGRTRAQLFADVYAAPLDDGPRAVLADLLIERGDPRGELIALQLRPSAGPKAIKREAALRRAAGNQWFDGLDEDGAKEIQLARGFPVRATCGEIACRAPGWATIETLVVTERGPRDLRPLAALHTLYGWPTSRLAELAGHPLHTLSVTTRAGLDAGKAPKPRQLGVIDRETPPRSSSWRSS